jgi:hypothetical protein
MDRLSRLELEDNKKANFGFGKFEEWRKGRGISTMYEV